MAKTSNNTWLLLGGGLLLLLLTNMNAWSDILKTFLPQWEGFKPHPYWDIKQWSWGYGTRVPGSVNSAAQNPGGTITKQKALQDALQHVNTDYLYLKGLLTRQLNNKQWAALLSFAYNLGTANADNLVPNINSGSFAALGNQWKQYINADGIPLQQLIDRRNAEWNLFVS